MSTTPSLLPPSKAGPPAAFGIVSFLNARPLREFLPSLEGAVVRPEVPSRLIELLDAGACDVALLPVVDYWRARHRLQIVSNACIASEGETLTVRVFSRKPAERVERLLVDGDSHTSVTLARLIWEEMYDRRLEVVACDAVEAARRGDAEAVLLIGDKVVTQSPRGMGFGFEMDLGAAWKHLTDLPFVFAAWYGAAGRDYSTIARTLAQARDRGVADARRIARETAAQHGWPAELAERYLCDIMKYRLTPAMRAGMDRFFIMADKRGLLS